MIYDLNILQVSDTHRFSNVFQCITSDLSCGLVSFVNNRFNLVVRPKAKRAEYFNLATPLAVRGSFEDFSIGMNAGVLSLGTTAVNFAISPITTPIKRVFKDELPEDGADICALPIGSREQELDKLPGC